MKIEGKVAVVTGSAKRVGKMIALALASKGANIMVHYRNSRKEAMQTVREIRTFGVKAGVVSADLTSPVECKKIIFQTLKKFGGIHILVNSASLYQMTPLMKIGTKEWNSHMQINLQSAFFLSQKAGKVMLKQKQGKIVNIIDSDVVKPYKHYLPYLVSKSGLVGLTTALAIELAPHIQVNAISPGPVLLPEVWGAKEKRKIIAETPLQRMGTPQDIANAVLFCIEGTDFMTGAVIPVDGGQHIG